MTRFFERFSKPKTEAKIYPFERRRNFLTPTEKEFFEALVQIINNQYFIFPQIHIASILQVQTGRFDWLNWKRYFNQIIQKSFDFVIFDKQTLLPLLVIELDDYTHNQPKRQRRDFFIDQTLKAANLSILHIQPGHNAQELKQLILGKLTLCSPLKNAENI